MLYIGQDKDRENWHVKVQKVYLVLDQRYRYTFMGIHGFKRLDVSIN